MIQAPSHYRNCAC